MRRRVINYDSAKPSIAFMASSLVSGPVTPHTHSVAFGSDHATRHIAVSVNSVAAVTDVTIGGVAAAQAIAVGVGGFYSTYVSIWIAKVPAGASGNVIVTAPPATISIAHVFRIVGILSATPTATASQASLPTAMPLSVQGLGVVVAAEGHVHGATSGSPSWTGGVTQVATTAVAPVVAQTRLCSALYEASSPVTLSLGVAISNPASPCGCAASFR